MPELKCIKNAHNRLIKAVTHAEIALSAFNFAVAQHFDDILRKGERLRAKVEEKKR